MATLDESFATYFLSSEFRKMEWERLGSGSLRPANVGTRPLQSFGPSHVDAESYLAGVARELRQM